MGQIYRYIIKPWDGKEMRGVLTRRWSAFICAPKISAWPSSFASMSATSIRSGTAPSNFGQLVGESPTLQAALGRAEQVARTTATVLLRGETGTGKSWSRTPSTSTRRASPSRLCASNCAALAAGVLESELFGHERGASRRGHPPSWPL